MPLGITLDGPTVMLDFEIGARESTEVCDALLGRLVHHEIAIAVKHRRNESKGR